MTRNGGGTESGHRRRTDRVRYREFALALDHPLATARGSIDRREGFLVAATVGDTTGVGEATPLPGWTESLAECRDALDDAAVGPVPGTDAPAARHAVTLARRDAFARRRGTPVAATLAADPAESVPANATVGDGSVEDTVAAAKTAVAAGFRTLKVKVGARPLGEDVERVRTVANEIETMGGTDEVDETDATDTPSGFEGGGVTLRADANGAWDRETARRALSDFAGLVEYVEQPLPAQDIAGHAALRGAGAPVALDESLATRDPFEVVAADAADVLVVKPMALGGLERSLAVARAAAHRGVDSVVTTTVDAAVARTAAVHLAAAIPGGGERAHGLATAGMLVSDVVSDPAPVADGHVRVPTGPGLAGGAFDGLV